MRLPIIAYGLVSAHCIANNWLQTECRKLRVLHISKNQMGSESVIGIAAALRLCPQLSYVDLTQNGVDGRACRLACELHQCASAAHMTLEHVTGRRLKSGYPLLERYLLI